MPALSSRSYTRQYERLGYYGAYVAANGIIFSPDFGQVGIDGIVRQLGNVAEREYHVAFTLLWVVELFDFLGPRQCWLPVYRILGMSGNQIEIIQTATQKEHYYGPGWRAANHARPSPLELGIAGAASDDDVTAVKALYATPAPNWVRHHLVSKGIRHDLAA